MLGLRGERGWCGGFGIVPEFRGMGLANWLCEKLVERGRELELATLQLEVLAQNEMGERTFASCAAADRALYVRTEGHLYRIQAK